MKEGSLSFFSGDSESPTLHFRTFSTKLGSMVSGFLLERCFFLQFFDNPNIALLLVNVLKKMRQKQNTSVLDGQSFQSSHFFLSSVQKLEFELSSYFNGNLTSFSSEILLCGTPFQEAVWSTLCAIEYGNTRSYSDIANFFGMANGARAIGGTNALNPIAILVPCHRLVAKNGSLQNYGGGVLKKQYLLDLES